MELRLYNVRARQSIYGREYTGAAANPRIYAHTMSDDLHDSQRKLRGVARTKLIVRLGSQSRVGAGDG